MNMLGTMADASVFKTRKKVGWWTDIETKFLVIYED